MQTKNLYFRSVLKRQNVVKTALLNVFLMLSSYPRLVLEVFIRKNFGERYFSIGSVVGVTLFLLAIPTLAHQASSFLSFSEGYDGYDSPKSNFWLEYGTWYLFLLGFLYFSYQRWREIKINPSVFDFGRFSLYSGDIHPLFSEVSLIGQKPTIRQIEILIEPALFLLAGIILYMFGQALGMLLIVTSIIYCLSYAGAYRAGDDFIMDKVDEIIMNEEMQSAFVEDKDTSQTRGVRFYARKPKAKDLREKLSHSILDDDAADVR